MRLIRVQLISTKSTRWFPVGNDTGLSHAQPAEQPARGALNDLCTLEFGKRAQCRSLCGATPAFRAPERYSITSRRPAELIAAQLVLPGSLRLSSPACFVSGAATS
jgi:hypothetical protein